jgi:hypothetical protein
MVGNSAQFGTAGNYIDRYTLINLSKPFVVINNSTPVNGAVYNDLVNFYVTDVQYALELFGQEYYDKYFYISNMTVWLEDTELEKFTIPAIDKETGDRPLLAETKHSSNSFVFSQRGKYTVEIRYRIGQSYFLSAIYTFQIIPSALPMEAFEYTIQTNIEITKIARNGYNITNNYNLTAGSKIAFTVADGVGVYTVQGTTRGDDINRAVPQSFQVSIDRKNISSSIRVEGVGSGAASNTPVTLTYYPYYLFIDGQKREVIIVIYKDGAIVEDYPIVTVNAETVDALRSQQNKDSADLTYQNTLETVPIGDNGQYVIAVFDADDDCIYSYTFAIEGVKSKRGMVVAMFLGGALLIATFVFIRIRSKMKVK